MQELASFAAKWSHPDYPPEAIPAGAIEQAEKQLGAQLPADYRKAVLEVGLPHPTLALLHSISEGDSDLDDMSEFFDPAGIVESTEGWRDLGLPADKIAFATDCMGNMFCFDTVVARHGSAVWYFDHDTAETRQVAASFKDWLQQYLDLKFIPLDDLPLHPASQA